MTVEKSSGAEEIQQEAWNQSYSIQGDLVPSSDQWALWGANQLILIDGDDDGKAIIIERKLVFSIIERF